MKHEGDIEHIHLEDEQDHGHSSHTTLAVENRAEYKKLVYVLLAILLVSSLLTFIRGISLERFMADFMAVFFITFAGFKFVDIEGFAHAYRMYDVLAKRIRPWAYAYPFIEAFLGVWYLLSAAPLRLNLLAMAITGIASIGVYQEIRKKSRFHCACLGTFIRLPLSRVSLIENLTMFIMAFAMVLL